MSALLSPSINLNSLCLSLSPSICTQILFIHSWSRIHHSVQDVQSSTIQLCSSLARVHSQTSFRRCQATQEGTTAVAAFIGINNTKSYCDCNGHALALMPIHLPVLCKKAIWSLTAVCMRDLAAWPETKMPNHKIARTEQPPCPTCPR